MSDTTHQGDQGRGFRNAVKLARLVDRVEQDHPVEAQWLRDNLTSRGFTQPDRFMGTIVSLSGLFMWDNSPQGHTFWSSLEKKLRAEGFYDHP